MSNAHEGYEDFATDMTARLMRRALLLVRDRQTAEDLVQDTLVRLYEQWRRVQRADDPEAYTQQILYRLFVSRTRRKSGGEVVGTVGETADTFRLADRVALRVAIADQLSTLPAWERVVLITRYLDDLSVEDTAHQLGRSAAWVRTTTHRAVTRLRARADIGDLLTAS